MSATASIWHSALREWGPEGRYGWVFGEATEPWWISPATM